MPAGAGPPSIACSIEWPAWPEAAADPLASLERMSSMRLAAADDASEAADPTAGPAEEARELAAAPIEGAAEPTASPAEEAASVTFSWSSAEQPARARAPARRAAVRAGRVCVERMRGSPPCSCRLRGAPGVQATPGRRSAGLPGLRRAARTPSSRNSWGHGAGMVHIPPCGVPNTTGDRSPLRAPVPASGRHVRGPVALRRPASADHSDAPIPGRPVGHLLIGDGPHGQAILDRAGMLLKAGWHAS